MKKRLSAMFLTLTMLCSLMVTAGAADTTENGMVGTLEDYNTVSTIEEFRQALDDDGKTLSKNVRITNDMTIDSRIDLNNATLYVDSGVTLTVYQIYVDGTENNSLLCGAGSIKRLNGTIGNGMIVANKSTLTVQGLTIDGGAVWSGNETLQRGTDNVNGIASENKSSLLKVSGGTLYINGVTVQNQFGTAAQSSPILVRDQGILCMEHSTVRDNALNTPECGVITTLNGTNHVEVNDSVFFGNIASAAGSILYQTDGSNGNDMIVFNRCEIRNNATGTQSKKNDGYLFYFRNGNDTLTLNHCNIHDNSNSNTGKHLISCYDNTKELTVVLADTSIQANTGDIYSIYTHFSGDCIIEDSAIDPISSLFIDGALGKQFNVPLMSSHMKENGLIVSAGNGYELTESDAEILSRILNMTLAVGNNGIYPGKVVTFNANNGTGATTTQKVPDGIPTQLQDNPFTYPGYTFVEWNTSFDGTGDTYKADIKHTFINDKTLYAKWTERQLSTIEVNPINETVPYGTILTADDFTVTATYDNGEREEVTADSLTHLNAALTTLGPVTVTATYQDKTATCEITVTKAPQTAPDAPTLQERTTTSITLASVEGAEYRCSGGEWQTSPEFTGLTDGTTYTFQVRYAETDTHLASDPSSEAEFSTLRRSSGGSSSSSPAATTHSVTATTTKNGAVSFSTKNAKKGDTVTITVKPNAGYVLDSITLKGASGKEIALTDKGDGVYTFTMPASAVTVAAVFTEIPAKASFADVSDHAYYADAVAWAVQNGVTSGVADGLFGPDASCTRGQIVTFLWRAAGSPEPESSASFSDVSAGSYYEKAVAWAVEQGVTSGTGDGVFSPDAPCTRAQSVTFLYRTLGQLTGGKAAFGDVSADSYYADAVAWAVEHGVTSGVANGLFGPDNACTRGQIVTFLFKAYQGQ